MTFRMGSQVVHNEKEYEPNYKKIHCEVRRVQLEMTIPLSLWNLQTIEQKHQGMYACSIAKDDTLQKEYTKAYWGN